MSHDETSILSLENLLNVQEGNENEIVSVEITYQNYAKKKKQTRGRNN